MNTDLINKIAINESKHKELEKKIMYAIENHKGFRILAIDIDNTLIDDNPLRDKMLREILGDEYDMIMQRADEMYKSGKPDDMALSSFLIGDMYDRVYEEAELRFVGKMRYNEIYTIDRFFPGTIEFVKNLLATKGEFDFVILLSHHNVPREANSKINLMYEVFPTLDGIYLPRYHAEPYGTKGRPTVSKVGFLRDEILGREQTPVISNLKVYLANNIFMVDDSTTVLLDTLSKRANIVPFLPSQVPQIKHMTYDEFLSRASLYCDLSRVYGDISNLNEIGPNKRLIK